MRSTPSINEARNRSTSRTKTKFKEFIKHPVLGKSILSRNSSAAKQNEIKVKIPSTYATQMNQMKNILE